MDPAKSLDEMLKHVLNDFADIYTKCKRLSEKQNVNQSAYEFIDDIYTIIDIQYPKSYYKNYYEQRKLIRRIENETGKINDSNAGQAR